MSKKPSPAPIEGAEPDSYEAAIQELQGLVQRMESGDMTLESSLKAYQRGALLIKYCESQLNAAEEQIKLLETSSSPAGDDTPF